ncbi:MAG: germination protein YpeB, partial [Clostridia bacterium]|nr:germination protein YpeB [Clostridia bacterium]
MENKDNRIVIRIFAAAAAVVLIISLVTCWIKINRLERELDNSFRRALIGLAESVEGIDIELKKCLCSGTQEGFAENAAMLWSHSQQAKMLLGEIASADELWKVELFLSQVGDYAMCASRCELGTEQHDDLIALSRCSQELRLMLEDIINDLDGAAQMGERDAVKRLSEANVDNNTGLSGLEAADDAFTSYPKLIYDGAFSDHIYEKEPCLLQGLEKVSAKQAAHVARDFSGEDKVRYIGEQEGCVPCYLFSCGDAVVAVTMQGGIVNYMLSERMVEDINITADEAVSRAKRFLKNAGYKNMQKQYFEVYGNKCVVNFVPVIDGVVVYPDQIKLAVSLDSGEILSFDARDYIMNHRERDCFEAQKTRLQ